MRKPRMRTVATLRLSERERPAMSRPTDNQINIAIAEACGWEAIMEACVFDGRPIVVGLIPGIAQDIRKEIPNYCADLNAMWEAEKTFSNDTVESRYALELLKMVSRWAKDGFSWGDQCENDFFRVANATARQRAEAFLRTLGKWPEEKE